MAGGLGKAPRPGPTAAFSTMARARGAGAGLGRRGGSAPRSTHPPFPIPSPRRVGGVCVWGGSLHPSPPHGSRGAAATRREGMEGGGGSPAVAPPHAHPASVGQRSGEGGAG